MGRRWPGMRRPATFSRRVARQMNDDGRAESNMPRRRPPRGGAAASAGANGAAPPARGAAAQAPSAPPAPPASVGDIESDNEDDILLVKKEANQEKVLSW